MKNNIMREPKTFNTLALSRRIVFEPEYFEATTKCGKIRHLTGRVIKTETIKPLPTRKIKIGMKNNINFRVW